MQLRGQGKAALLLTGVLMAGPALAHKAGDVIVRLGGIKVDPDASTSSGLTTASSMLSSKNRV